MARETPCRHRCGIATARQAGEEIRKLLKLNERTLSLDVPLTSIPSFRLAMHRRRTVRHPELQFEQAEIKHNVAGWVAQLTGKQRFVIEQRYGLNGYEVAARQCGR